VRSAQRATPTTPRTPRGSHIHTPRGVAGDGPLMALSAMPVSHQLHGALVGSVSLRRGFPTLPGFPSQPTSSRSPLSDDRFESNLASPRRTNATPRPNFYSLDEDRRAWEGGKLSTLRAGKTFSFTPMSERLASSSTDDAPTPSSKWWYEQPNDKPLSPSNDRLLPEAQQAFGRPNLGPRWQGAPRATFAPVTSLPLDTYVPRKCSPAAIRRLHAGVASLPE